MLKRILTLDGLPVEDARETVYIGVTKRDATRQGRKNPETCALALACKRELGCDDVRVYRTRIYIKQKDHWIRYALSESAAAEIKAFDKYGGFSAGMYQIRPVIHYDKSESNYRYRDRTTSPKPRGHREVEGVRSASPLTGGAIERSAKE